MYAHALLNHPREDFGRRRAASELLEELDEWREPTRLVEWRAHHGR